MNFLKNIFQKKEPQEVSTDIQDENNNDNQVRGECILCGKDIFMIDRYSKQNGKLFHKKCWKDAKRRVTRGDLSI